MTPEQKAKLEGLRAKKLEDLSETEKTELDLLATIEKQLKQITEKDSLIGTKATEIEQLRAAVEGKSGKDKESAEELLKAKEEAMETMKMGLDALKDAHKITAESISKKPEESGHRETVDPEELKTLEVKAYANAEVRAEIENFYKGMEPEDKLAYRTDDAFKKKVLERFVGSDGDETETSLWSKEVTKTEGVLVETAEERLERLFGEKQGNHRRLPPNSAGRGSRGKPMMAGMPKPAEREVDTRSQ